MNDITEVGDQCEKTLTSGETLTIAVYNNGYDVDCWDDAGNCRWTKHFKDEQNAIAEYNRWK